MIDVRLATEDDRDAWNRVAFESPHGTYAHTWEWAEVIETGLGIRPLKLVAEENGEILGIFSGFLKPYKSRFVLFSPLDVTWDYGGPCTIESAHSQTFDLLIKEMEKAAKKNKAVSLRISPFFNHLFDESLTGGGYRRSERLTSIIDLSLKEDELFMALDKKTRNQVRQSEKNRLVVGQASDGVDEFFNCLADTAERTGMELPTKKFFDTAIRILAPVGMAKIHHVKLEGEILGSSLCFYFKDYMVTRYWTAYSDHMKLRPYHALIWHLLTEGKKDGIKICDLGGMPSDPSNGIYKFKKGWSGKIVNADWYIKDVYLSSMRALKRRMKGSR